MRLTDNQISELASPFVTMLETLKGFYDDPKNKEKYRQWHLEKYGCLPET